MLSSCLSIFAFPLRCFEYAFGSCDLFFSCLATLPFGSVAVVSKIHKLSLVTMLSLCLCFPLQLEEFRKKKAAERAKKAANNNQPHASDVISEHKQPLETERVRLIDSDGAGTSDGSVEPFGVSINNGNNTIDITKNIEQSSLRDAAAKPPPLSVYNTSFADIVQRHSHSQDYASGFPGVASFSYGQETDETSNDSRLYTGDQGGFPILSDHSIAPRPQASQDFHSSSSQSSLYGKELLQSKEINSSARDSAVMNHGSHIFASPQNSTSSQLQAKPGNGITPVKGIPLLF